MKIYEYRIICPCTVEQNKIGSIYMTSKRSEEESKQVKGEGVETVNNEPFSNEKESGIYTYKILHFKSRIPSFMRWALPDKYCHCHEKSWNAYPHVHTEYSVPGMGDDLLMNVDSTHLPYKDGEEIPDNSLNLSKEDLAIRKVVYLDILDGRPKPKADRDLSNWACPQLNVNEKFSSFGTKKLIVDLYPESKPPEWTHNFKGEMMVQIKVVKIKFQWRGLESIVESFATTTFYHNLFLDNTRAMLRWADQWSGMTLDDVKEFERKTYEKTNQQGFEKDDDKPDVEPPSERPQGVPEKPNIPDDQK